MIASSAYAVISPYILPFAMIYYLGIFFVWRYQQLYVYQATYNLRGQIWTFVAHRVVACLAMMTLFTGITFLFKKAYIQGCLTIILLEILLIVFDRYLTSRYDSVYAAAPVGLLESAPRVELDSQSFVPPPLKPKAEGWFLEWGKAWEFFGSVRAGV